MQFYSKSKISLYEAQAEYNNKLLQSVPSTLNHIYVTKWINEGPNFYAIGIDEITGKLSKFKAPFTSCLFVWLQHDSDLCLVLQTKYIQATNITKPDVKPIKHNGYSAIQYMMQNCSHKSNPMAIDDWYVYRLPTNTFQDSRSLYYQLNDSEKIGIAGYVKTPGIWTLETQIMIELYCIYKNWNKCHMYSVYMDHTLHTKEDTESIKFDTLSFDIETVSHEDTRIPMGHFKTDAIFSASFTKICPSTGEKLHETIFNIPVNTESCDYKDKFSRISKLMEEDKSSDCGMERKITIFNNEVDTLKYICSRFDKMPSQYLLLGYNSKNYDMLFLLRRVTYLNMKHEMTQFNVQDGIIVYGTQMIHIDLYLVINKYFMNELDSFTLKNVAIKLLDSDEDNKVDFDARLLRYIYADIMKDNKVPENGSFDKYKANIALLAHYNDKDALLVYTLWDTLQYNEFLLNVAKSYRICLSRISQSMVNEYLSVKMLIDSFIHGVLFTQHHNNNVAQNQDTLTYFNTEILSSIDGDTAGSYGGGFNFRDAKNVSKNVEMMDMVAYYPEMMEGFNLSHETCAIYKVGALMKLTKNNQNSNIFRNIDMYRFCTHKSSPNNMMLHDTDLLNAIDSKRYTSGSLDNASKITAMDLNSLDHDERIVIIINNHRGVLSLIMQDRNNIRNVAKNTKRLLNQAIQNVQEYIQKKELQAMCANDDDDFDPDADEDDEDEEEVTNEIDAIFNAKDYIIDRHINESENEELYLVQSKIRILNYNELMKLPMNILKSYSDLLKSEFVQINAQYRNLKIVNSSCYGLLGSSYGLLRGRHVAAIATMFGRKFIIKTAIVGRELGFTLILSDTDSVFLAPTNVKDSTAAKQIIDRIKDINSCLQLNNKTYPMVFVIAKKTYFALYNEIFSRGINKNGPSIWVSILDNLVQKYIIEQADIYMSNVKPLLISIYLDVYKHMKVNKSIVLCNMNAKHYSEYKSQTPVKKLMDRILEQNSGYVFGKSIRYFHKWQNNPRTVCFALEYELENTPISMINLYKFLSKIKMAIYSILSMALIITNKKRNVYYTINSDDFDKINIISFIEARQQFQNAGI